MDGIRPSRGLTGKRRTKAESTSPPSHGIERVANHATIALEAMGADTPIDFHSHGVGPFDFVQIPTISLDAIEQRLRASASRSILVFYLVRHYFDALLKLIEAFGRGRLSGRYRYILGIGIEGPVIASPGGTPSRAVWLPTKTQWRRLSALGGSGLRYVILSPDARTGYGALDAGRDSPDVDWIVQCLLEGGILPAPGHFRKDDPACSAACVKRFFKHVRRSGRGPTVSDHLFNDMPVDIPYAWRGQLARTRREKELQDLRLESWTTGDLESRLGPVPAAMLRGGMEGDVKLCMNFDGEHVDLAISKRTVELADSRNFLLMTDEIQSRTVDEVPLEQRDDSTLLYQPGGVVVGGSQTISRQLENMRSIGFTDDAIRNIAIEVATDLLGLRATSTMPPLGKGDRRHAVEVDWPCEH